MHSRMAFIHAISVPPPDPLSSAQGSRHRVCSMALTATMKLCRAVPQPSKFLWQVNPEGVPGVPHVAETGEQRQKRAVARANVSRPARCGECAACRQPWLKQASAQLCFHCKGGARA